MMKTPIQIQFTSGFEEDFDDEGLSLSGFAAFEDPDVRDRARAAWGGWRPSSRVVCEGEYRSSASGVSFVIFFAAVEDVEEGEVGVVVGVRILRVALTDQTPGCREAWMVIASAHLGFLGLIECRQAARPMNMTR